MIILNFKNYKTGKDALNLSRKIQKYLPKSIICPVMKDISEVAKLGMETYAQYVDSPKEIKQKGASGTLLNHSEHRVPVKRIEKLVGECKKVGLKVILCVENVSEAREYMKYKPDAIAFEDKKLIGSGKSITTYRQDDVKEFVNLLKATGIIPLCGAGIHSVSDVKVAYELGCKGVLISSAIAKVKRPERFLKGISRLK